MIYISSGMKDLPASASRQFSEPGSSYERWAITLTLSHVRNGASKVLGNIRKSDHDYSLIKQQGVCAPRPWIDVSIAGIRRAEIMLRCCFI